MTKHVDPAALAELVEAQHAEIKALWEQANTATNKNFAGVNARLVEVEQRMARRPGNGGNISSADASWGAALIASGGYTGFLESGCKGTGKITVPQAALTSISTSIGPMIAPDRQLDPIMLPKQRLVVRGLLGQSQTSSNLVQYPRQTVRDLHAATVSEGALKPQSNIEFELKDAPVRTIAHWVPVSRQAMDDAPQLQSVVDGELRYGLALTEETQLLLGDGTGENIFGLIPQSTAYDPPFSVASEQRLDTILIAIAQSELALLPATGIVINAMDWRKMQSLKDGVARYLGAGPFAQGPATCWSLPVVPSLSMTAGKFLVGAFATAATIYDRLQAEVLVSSEDRDNFIRNLLTVRAEERLAMAVGRPQALIYGTFPTAT